MTQAASRLGLLSLFAYAFFWLFDIEWSSYFEGMTVLLYVLAMAQGRENRAVLLSDPLFYVLLCWIAFQIYVYHWAAGAFPELTLEHIREARIISYIFMFLIISWWLDGDDTKVVSVLLLCVAGFYIGSLFQDHGVLEQLQKLSERIFYKRADFGYKNSEHTAVYASLSLLVLLCFRKRILTLFPSCNRWVMNFVIYLGVIFSLFVVVVVQTRTTWIALMITAAFAALILIYRTVFQTEKGDVWAALLRNKVKLLAGFSLFVITAASFFFLFDVTKVVSKRFGKESDVIAEVVEGDVADVRMSSLGKRLAVWEAAFEWVKERPLTGWGPQSRKVLVDQSDLPEKVKKKMRHLHNSYIELLVAYGAIGLGMFAGLFFYVWYRAWGLWRARKIPDDVMLFSALWSVYWLIVNATESYVIYSSTGQYIDAISAAVLYTYYLKAKKEQYGAA